VKYRSQLMYRLLSMWEAGSSRIFGMFESGIMADDRISHSKDSGRYRYMEGWVFRYREIRPISDPKAAPSAIIRSSCSEGRWLRSLNMLDFPSADRQWISWVRLTWSKKSKPAPFIFCNYCGGSDFSVVVFRP
jgi:hypothetical protein